jgi:hypothetical protein
VNIEVSGRFDQPRALRLRKTLLEEAPARSVHLDFTAATLAVDPQLLAALLISLHRCGRSVHLRGLPEEVRSFLLHFGIAAPAEGFAEFLLRDEVPFAD